MFRNTLKKIFTVLLTWVLKKSTLSNSSHALRQGNTNKTPLMERQKIERTEEVKGSEKSWGQSSSEVRAEERLKEAMTQHLRLRFLPWPERELDYSPSDWPEPSMIPTRDCYICLGVGGRKEVEVDSECYGEDGGGRARDSFPKSQHKVLTQITSPTSCSVTWSIRRTRTPV